jgi:hypothetical protein
VKSGHPWAFSNEVVMTAEARALPPGGAVRLEGDDVLFLHLSNIQRLETGRRMPLSTPELIAATALRERGTGVTSGVDHSGVAVYGAYAEVGTTGWMAVAKMSQEEALRSVRELASWISLLMLLAITSITVMLIMLWHQQQFDTEFDRCRHQTSCWHL